MSHKEHLAHSRCSIMKRSFSFLPAHCTAKYALRGHCLWSTMFLLHVWNFFPYRLKRLMISPKGSRFSGSYWQTCEKSKSLSHVQLSATTWAIVQQAPLSMEFSRPEYRSGGSHSLFQGIFPNQGLNLGLPHCRQILYHLSHQ